LTRWTAATLTGVAVLCWASVGCVEGFINEVEPVPLPEVTEDARALHGSALVADLHADSLLFRGDLTKRVSRGHVDLPRLREGGVGLQVFGVVTHVYAGTDIDRTEAGGLDLVTLLGCITLRRACFAGPFGRLEEQAGLLAENVERDEHLVWIRTAADLERLRERRAADPGVIGVTLGIEGAHALEGDPAKLERAFELGVRMIGLAHFFDNAYSGSVHGVEKRGLTDVGRDTLVRMEELGIAVDLAHLSPAGIDETLALVTKPVVVSHGGAKGTCDNARTLSDAHLRAIAENGGVVGVGYWDTAICGTAPADVARAIRYVADLVGDDHVALGSDYDGATTVGFDTSALPALTQSLLDAGLAEGSIRKILGGNVRRVFAATLP
jgi:microsomal dipeptidase-like Zn-dependent dipeptidase